MRDFKEYVESENMKFPVAEADFNKMFSQFLIRNDMLKSNNMGFINGNLKYLHINFLWQGYHNGDHIQKQ